MFMSWCPTGPKSTYLLFPRPHNGTGCYVNESVPELIYALLNFMGVWLLPYESYIVAANWRPFPELVSENLQETSHNAVLEVASQDEYPWSNPPISHRIFAVCILVGGLEHLLFFPSYWECHHPNWRSHIFQSGRSTTNQRKYIPVGCTSNQYQSITVWLDDLSDVRKGLAA